MGIGDAFERARSEGEAAISDMGSGLRSISAAVLRSRLGLTEEPPPPCDDPEEAFIAPSSPVRIVHSDLGAMLIGGLSSLLLQSLHPLAMAGVAQHSRFREDPLGRLERTATFVGTTTFRSSEEAAAAISRVRRVHESVRGNAADGTPYRASDPHLLRWVHVAEISSFLAAFDRLGSVRLSEEQRDGYVADMAKVAEGLGAEDVPLSAAELGRAIEAYRPELRMTPEALEARRLVLFGVRRLPHELAVHVLLAAEAVEILPDWARRELGLASPGIPSKLAVEPMARILCSGLRLVVPPMGTGPQVVSVSPPSTVTT